jgi:4-hydroxy-tetrahydrodipicolinate synthase
MGRLHGILVPVITPFTDEGAVDLDGLRLHLDALIAGGVHGIIPAGSTGEAMSLTATEYRSVIQTTIEHVAGRVPVIAGCSANATSQVIDNCRQATDLGADAVMLVHPFYSLPDERELTLHYEAVSASVALPVIIYNNPFTTGVDASPQLFGRLSRLTNLDYVKESSGDCTRVIQILDATQGRMDVLCGTDNQALEQLAAGATGWVAGTANALPEQCVALYDLITNDHDLVAARALYREIFEYLTLAEGTGKFVQINKAAVEVRGRRAGAPRMPLQPIDDALRSQLDAALSRALEARLPSARPVLAS